ncbi:MAG: FAD-binding oxidoreductase [Acidobacteriota bacterium]|nr:FAD-binding oxidoreductase [Acidobacteriota bacterium]
MNVNGASSRVLPKGLAPRDFENALQKFAVAIGDEWVISSENELKNYRDPFAFASADPREFAPSAAVKPASVEEVRSIVRIANELKVPLWVISRGKNLGYGGAAPRVAGSVTIDLGRMNRILEVNEELCYAVVEPGVTFFDLYEHIQGRKLKLWISVPALGWGSVVGNALDRGVGYTPYGEHSENICGMEVVLPDGGLIRTGMGALSHGKTWHSFKPGYGPSVDGLFMQSNFGIVTKAGIWLMPQPDFFVACDLHFERESDLERIVDITGELRREDIVQNTAVLSNAVRLISRLGARDAWFAGGGAAPESAVQAKLQEMGLGAWNLRFAIYGAEELAEARLKIAKRAYEAIAGARFESKKWDVRAHGAEEFTAAIGSESVQAGVPSLFALEVLKYRGEDGGHIGFSPILAPSGKEAVKLANLAGRLCREHGFDYYGGFSFGFRHLWSVMMILYDKKSDEHRAQADRLFRRLVKEAGELGFAEYRAHVEYMDLVGDPYDFNGHALRRFTETLKDAVDPGGILAPGKQGIWPKRMRENGGQTQ